MIQIAKNIGLRGSGERPVPTDIFYDDRGKSPVVIYTHGFNGFKDWGNFDLIANQFVQAGFTFVKFNFSHNGTTQAHPDEFVDLDAYAENNYSRELYDLSIVFDWMSSESAYHTFIDQEKIGLIGHSRGGAIALLQAWRDIRVRAVTTWASVAECKTPWGTWSDDRMQEWKDSGIAYIANSRTKQQMPLHYQLYEDYQSNRQQLDVEAAARNLNVPLLICHGTADEAVPVAKAYLLHQRQPTSELFLVDGDHVFGRRHPWMEKSLPVPMQQVLDRTLGFFAQKLV